MIAAIPTLPRGKLGEVGPYEQLDEWHVQNAGGLKEVMDVGERVDLREARGILSLCEFRKFTFGSEFLDHGVQRIESRANFWNLVFRNGRSAPWQASGIRREHQRARARPHADSSCIVAG